MKYMFPFLSGFLLIALFSPLGHARFYDSGIGDPHKNSSVEFIYNTRKPVVKIKVKKKPPITYRARQKRIYKLAQQSRRLPLPDAPEYTPHRGHEVAERYVDFFNVPKHGRQFAKADFKLNKIRTVPKDPNFLAAQRSDKRAWALLDLYNEEYRFAMTSLWQLALNKRSPGLQQQKDALFAGMAASFKERHRMAMMAFEYALRKGLARPVKDKRRMKRHIKRHAKFRMKRQKDNLKYLDVLLSHASYFKDQDSIDKLVRMVDSHLLIRMPVKKELDKIVFALARNKYATNESVLKRLEQRLSEKTELKEKMQLLRALAYIENRKHKTALPMLKKLAMSENKNIHHEARINLARLLAMFSQYSQALKIYRSLPMDYLTQVDALVEIAWLEFENQQYDFSLGKSIGLQSKFFSHAFIPEVYVLEAYSRKSMCDFGGAETTINKFKQDYTHEIRDLRNLLRRKKRNKKFSMYAEIKNAFRKEKNQRMRRYERYLLQAPGIASRQKELFEIQQEYRDFRDETLAKIVVNDEKYMKNHEFLLDTFHDYYVRTKKKYSPKIESEIYEELKYLDHKLFTLFQQAEYLHLDIAASADINHSLQSAMNYPVLPEKKEEPLPVTINRWAFEDNEFWEDEIGWLRVKNPSKCVPKDNDQEKMEHSLAGI